MTDRRTKSELLRALGAGRPDVNRYGLDCHYFRKNLRHILEHMDNYTPEELSRALARLSSTANQ